MQSAPDDNSPSSADPIRSVVKQYWGYDSLRPLQHEAMSAGIAGRDALVVLPTGGGKSLCYQAPALLRDQPTVVVSPLIALMKDQVDALISRGISAAFLNSSLTMDDRRRVEGGVANGEYKLLFVAPERFASQAFWNLLDSSGVGAFAIDEAHCISHWGHDFRGDYRRLDQLNERFPDAAIQAFTATATPRVRDDIVEQLSLREPAVLVGDFFRPNLNYRVQARGDVFGDILKLIEERPRLAGIVYCMRRRDVDELSQFLKSSGVEAAGYHAGMSDIQRSRVQDRFASMKTDVVVATVAFGMGIDRSDIRFVIHAAMPKSIEHYQQETGRAGRDNLPADCILLYSGSDLMAWKRIMERDGAAGVETAMPLLNAMARFCTGIRCRHKALVTYFGQAWSIDRCGACDMCSDNVTTLDDSTVRAQKIMSAVKRTGERFGAAYVCEVLLGSETQSVRERGHASLSTFGIMADDDKSSLMAWVDQLVDQELLIRDGEYRILKITEAGWRVLRSQAEARLLPVKEKKRTKRRQRVERPSRSSDAKTNRPTGTVPESDCELEEEPTALFERLREVRL
ncbi:MAG: RecQ family ATP-dependent DNA helicase, partial [Planctomycetes bacterium]|nr:RecQ family ATP-dependent DNA helicase [Planctomycetota bacterium]